jgi:hypothetical protein
LEKGNLSIKMDRYTMVIGSMTKWMDMEFIAIVMEINMKVIG